MKLMRYSRRAPAFAPCRASACSWARPGRRTCAPDTRFTWSTKSATPRAASSRSSTCRRTSRSSCTSAKRRGARWATRIRISPGSPRARPTQRARRRAAFHPLAECRLYAPVRPSKLITVGRNYPGYARATAASRRRGSRGVHEDAVRRHRSRARHREAAGVQRARFRDRARGRHRQAMQARRGRRRVQRRRGLHDPQRRHRARHRDARARRRQLFLGEDLRHLRADGAVAGDARSDTRSRCTCASRPASTAKCGRTATRTT